MLPTVSFVSLSSTPLRPVRCRKGAPFLARCTAIQLFFANRGSDACAEWLPMHLKLSNCA
jgi:hypothetical protein